MTRTFWDFCFAIRSNVTGNIRHKLLVGLLFIMILVPGDRLRTDFFQEMVETHSWLLGLFSFFFFSLSKF